MVRLAAQKGKGNVITRPILGYYAEYNDAQSALVAYNHAPVENINITLVDLWEEWKLTRSYTGISKSSRDCYNMSWNRLSVIGQYKVKDIRTAHLQKVIDESCANNLSHSAIKKDRAIMTALFNYASQNDIVQKNYATFVKIPVNNEISTKDAFSDIELTKIEKAAADGVPFADTVLILCYTGFRIQELLNLTPFSYDCAEKTLTGGLKTHAGKNRVIPIHPKIQCYIDRWYAKKGERLICKEDGKPHNQKYFREKCYMSSLEQIGFRPERQLLPHCCRHTFATLMHRKNIGEKERLMLIGHTDIEMTMRYTHADLEALKRAINIL